VGSEDFSTLACTPASRALSFRPRCTLAVISTAQVLLVPAHDPVHFWNTCPAFGVAVLSDRELNDMLAYLRYMANRKVAVPPAK